MRAALVTGGASGIGRQVCRTLSALGMRVVIADADLDGAKAAATECPGQARAVHCVLPEQEDIRRTVAETVAWGGSMEVLVNVAGIVDRVDVAETTPERWQQVMDVNLTGLFLMCREAVPRMLQSYRGHRRIVNVASCAADIGYAYPAYTASKGGVVSLTRQLARELAPHEVTVNCISPGFVSTPINEAAFADQTKRDAVVGKIPLGRLGRPEEVAETVSFLASPGAGFINAEVIHVDGGMLGAMPPDSTEAGLRGHDG